MKALSSDSTATSDKYSTWSLIDWGEVEQFVRSMQIKIADAAKRKDWRKVTRLQYSLTHSFRAKLLAVKTVTSNSGNRTSGVDNVIWSTGESKLRGAKNLSRQGYKPAPLRRVEIPKADGSMRPLGIPTMYDRAMQCLYKFALEPVAEVTADKDSYGFRRKRSCADAIEACFLYLGRKTSAQWVLEGDIEKCFDRISHEWLLNNIPMDKGILEKWLKSGFIFQETLFPTDEGTPQGGVISPTLANMTLDGIQKLIEDKYCDYRGRRDKTQVYFIRYADDFIITSKHKETLTDEVIPMLEKFLAERGLQLSKKKTVITHINNGFDFLGFTVRKFRDKLLTKPSKKSVVKFVGKIKYFIDKGKGMRQDELIGKLNVMIQGWANYFKHGVSKDSFDYVDYRIWQMLWKWACRRHPSKGKRWIREKYFSGFKTDTWRFVDTRTETILAKAGGYKIVRHIKIQKDAEVFNPVWDDYFESR
jgi:RNA-directed DNA polymerase